MSVCGSDGSVSKANSVSSGLDRYTMETDDDNDNDVSIHKYLHCNTKRDGGLQYREMSTATRV